METQYTLELPSNDKKIFVVAHCAFLLVGIALWIHLTKDPSIFGLAFMSLWTIVVVKQCRDVLKGPKKIIVSGDGSVALVDWFNHTSQIQINEINLIRKWSNLITMKTRTRTIRTLSAFPDLAKFVRDVKSANDQLVIKGIYL